jgi:hypothetical protein
MSLTNNVIPFPQACAARLPAAPAPAGAPLRRPRLLVQAARAGQPLYDRRRDLGRILGADPPADPGHALRRLLAEEARLELARREGRAEHDLQRHILVLVALMAEAASRRAAGAARPQALSGGASACPAHP